MEGVGPATARMLHLMPEICKYYTRCRASEENCLRTTEQLAEFLKSKFLGADRERALLMALDSRSRVRGAYWLREGTSSKVSFEIKDVVAAALKGGTDSVVLCHNHPQRDGDAFPGRPAGHGEHRPGAGAGQDPAAGSSDPDGNRIFFHAGGGPSAVL